MRRTLLLSLLVVGATVALAVGAVSVLADNGGPGHGADHGVATGLQDGGGGVGAQQDGGEPEATGARRNAQLIEEAFSVEPGSVWALHEEQGIGFGALFKLLALSGAMDGTEVTDLVSSAETNADGKLEFGFGQLRSGLSETESAALESGPKNLGQLKKAENSAAKAAKRQGPPEDVPANGNN